MITKKQSNLLEKLIYTKTWTQRVLIGEHSADKITLDEIEKEHPGTVRWLYGGAAGTVPNDSHYGKCVCELTANVRLLMEEYNETAVVGYDGKARDVRSGVEFDYHYRADNMSRLRSQLKRGRSYRDIEIITADPLTHDQWCHNYGWGRM